MEVVCSTCDRSFVIPDDRAQTAPAARCLCGARLALHVPASPAKLGKYVILRRIAVGGMGEIFHGKFPGVEGFEREVAIKKILPHLSEDQAFIDMMIKEAKLTVLLHHPNIVQVYDLAKEGKEYYIAMEYVPGVTVGHLLQLSQLANAHLPVEVAVHITMEVLRGLAYAHDLRGPSGEPMNVLHRDITPQNIMVTPTAWVKITDFGIAKARNEISTTGPGMIKGKLGYIAPEQLAGGVLDQRVDLFCAGILMWESLATHRLFKGVDEIDTFRLISECRVPALSLYRDDVPPEIEQALRGALTQLPENRYPTADDFYDALNQAIFPNTADEYANVTKRYFESKPELFESTATPRDVDDSDLTVEVSAVPEDEKLVEITTLVGKNQRRRLTGGDTRRRVPFAIAAAVVVGLAAVGGVFLKDRVLPSPPAEAAPAESPPPTSDTSHLTRDEVQLAVDGERARFLACYRLGNRSFRRVPLLTARLVIPSTGGVAAVDLLPGPGELGQVGPCIEKLLRGLKFRPHSAPKFETSVELPPPRAAQAPQPPTAGTSGAAKPLTAKEIQATVQRHRVSISKCLNGLVGVPDTPSKVNATITIHTSGRVTMVRFTPALPKASVEQCLRRSLKAIRLRKHPVKDFKVAIPLTITQI